MTHLRLLSITNNGFVEIEDMSPFAALEVLHTDNLIGGMKFLTDLPNLETLFISAFNVPITDLDVLVAHPGIDAGDTVYLLSPPLDCSNQELHDDLDALTNRGVTLNVSCEVNVCGSS